MASDAITLIKNDHRLLERLFDDLQAGNGDRRALVAEVSARLMAHSHAEEQHVYPAIAKADPGEQEEVEHAHDEHQEAEHLLRKVRNLVDSPHFEQALTEFVAAVQHHVQEEESEVLPALGEAVDEAALAQLGEAFERARGDELRGTGFDAGSEPRSDQANVTDATKAELYELAKEADVPGRSNMTKDELSRALREKG
jgi:hemerythrin superfamily protein